MKTFRELMEVKNKYEIYHVTYREAIEEILNHVKRNKMKVDQLDYQFEIENGQRKPSEGRTNQINMKLRKKDGKPAKKYIHAQIYGRSSDSKPYELNMYFGLAKLKEYMD